MPNALIGKVALVTGGSRGIGAAVVRRLANDGATVAFSYAASEGRAKALVAEIEKTGGTTLAIQADSADADAVKGAVAQTVDRFGRLDILVNNAGILIGGIVDDYPLHDFDRMVAVNVRAVFVAVQAAVPQLGRGGRIITTGSVAADRSGFLQRKVQPETGSRPFGSPVLTVRTSPRRGCRADCLLERAGEGGLGLVADHIRHLGEGCARLPQLLHPDLHAPTR